MIQYSNACFICGSTCNICMLPHRHTPSEEIVGWLFLCAKCSGKMGGKIINISVLENNAEAKEQIK